MGSSSSGGPIIVCLTFLLLLPLISFSFAFTTSTWTSTSTRRHRQLHRHEHRHRHQQSSHFNYNYKYRETLLCSTSTSTISNGIDYSFLRDHDVRRTKSYTQGEVEELLLLGLTEEQINSITTLVKRRAEARKDGDYDLADSIRDEINELGSTSTSTSTSTSSTSSTDSNSDIIILPSGFEIVIKDIPRKEGGGSTWSLQAIGEPIEWVDDDNEQHNDYDDNGDGVTPSRSNDRSVLQIAHAALGLATWSSENCLPLNQEKLDDLVRQAKRRLRKTGCRELRGRKAADSCFWFAMAGVNDDADEYADENANAVQVQQKQKESSPSSCSLQGYPGGSTLNFSLFDALVFICCEELRRFGFRQSCRAVDIVQMVERIAAAGVRSEMMLSLQKQALECLSEKDLSSVDLRGTKSFSDLEAGRFTLHSERTLLWIWRFSTRQRKQQTFLKSASKHWESRESSNYIHKIGTHRNRSIQDRPIKWNEVFDDPTLPLVVDIGCGMGVSILGLATSACSNKDAKIDNESELMLEWNNCNFFGADLSQLAINYASSISHRWKLSGRVCFEVISAEQALEKVVWNYPGPVKLIMIQFPTPFSFQKEISNEDDKSNNEVLNSVVIQGNRQLPKSVYNGFMVTEKLLDLAFQAVKLSSGKLLLQSNCEDVAVLMKNIAVNEAGFKTVDQKFWIRNLNEGTKALLAPKRAEKWIAMGGERAEGICWASTPLLPERGSTETELACMKRGRPVHRCLLEAKGVQ